MSEVLLQAAVRILLLFGRNSRWAVERGREKQLVSLLFTSLFFTVVCRLVLGLGSVLVCYDS